MTHLDRIQELYRYNTWANGKIMDAAGRLSPEDLVKDLRNSFPSIRDTLQHIVGAEWVWLQRWNGTSPLTLPTDWDLPTIDTIKAKWTQVERDQSAYLRTLTGDKLEAVAAYTNFKGEPCRYLLWQELTHVVNHSSYHRGQVTTMLRQLGAQVVSTDLLRYYDAIQPA